MVYCAGKLIENKRKACKSRACGSWFTSLGFTSVGYHTGKPIESRKCGLLLNSNHNILIEGIVEITCIMAIAWWLFRTFPGNKVISSLTFKSVFTDEIRPCFQEKFKTVINRRLSWCMQSSLYVLVYVLVICLLFCT